VATSSRPCTVLQGTGGSNTFDYNFSDGNEYISAYSIGNSGSNIVMGPPITVSDVTFQRGGGGPNWDLIVDVAGSGTIQIGAELSQRPISEIDFSDRTSIDLTGNLVFSANGAGQTVTPWTNGDTLTSSGFANTVLADSGAAVDYLFDSGDGKVAISNSNSAHQLDFGPAISDRQLGFTQSGNDLLINVIGS
jgi:trimeric autotransporter adhesin